MAPLRRSPLASADEFHRLPEGSARGRWLNEIDRIHASINHVPSTYVNVVYHELPAGGVYTDGVPANPVLVSVWVRAGHPEDQTTCLATEIAAAVARIVNIAADRVLVVIQTSPARFAVEGGRVCPSPAKSRPGSPQNDTLLPGPGDHPLWHYDAHSPKSPTSGRIESS